MPRDGRLYEESDKAKDYIKRKTDDEIRQRHLLDKGYKKYGKLFEPKLTPQMEKFVEEQLKLDAYMKKRKK